MADGNVDAGPAICSVALLGEIGDPAVLPEIVECLGPDDDDITMQLFGHYPGSRRGVRTSRSRRFARWCHAPASRTA